MGVSMANVVSLQLFCILFFSVKFGLCLTHLNVSCFGIERRALLEFKAGLEDPSGRLSSWIGHNCCRWSGVRCRVTTHRVVGLNLRNSFTAIDNSFDGGSYINETSALQGKISPSLVDLKYLSYFDLSGNDIQGKIPDFFGSFKNLRYLNLSGSSFSGSIPQSFSNLSNLQYLDLNSYGYGSVESDLRWMIGLSSLKHLNLGLVNLSGAGSYWLHSINTFPSLLELHFSRCELQNLPHSLPYLNFSSLLVLDISGNNFSYTGTIPQWLFNLSSLIQLDLSHNSLRGAIPDAFSKLSALEILDLSSNYGIEGKLPPSLGKLCHLKNLDLSSNMITGDITEFIGSLSQCSNNSFPKNLHYLSLDNNLLSGSVPETIGNLSTLKFLALSHNLMSGNITKNLAKLSSLESLWLEGNPWEGIITEDHLGNFSSLQELSIGGVLSSPNISLVFNISSDWVPPFKLVYIVIYSCQLDKFPKWLKNQTELTIVFLRRAMISGSIPEWFSKLNLQLEQFDVAYNQLTGKVPNSLRFLEDATVDLTSNSFEGPLPLWSSNLRELYMGDNLFSGPIPRDIGIRMPNLWNLNISNNFLDGSIPISLSNMTWLQNLDISNNRLSGKIPQIWDTTQQLHHVDMSNNNLIGLVGNANGSCSVLYLRLFANNLFGKFPSILKNCRKMLSLDIGDNQISGNLPAWIGESMPSLYILRVRNNSLTGNIPSRLCSLGLLHILDLSMNNFSGQIPPCIGYMGGFKTISNHSLTDYYGMSLQVNTKGSLRPYGFIQLSLMNSIDLSENGLSGEIPANISSLLQLVTLNLSMNHLTGMIPSDIGSLKVLESLDLSVNQLSGNIPTSMTSLNFLNHLNLSHNNLSGFIPTSGQFQSLNDPSNYEGNVALCGIPLSTKCVQSGDKEEFQKHEDEEEDDEDAIEKIEFFGVVGLGIISGFWGFVGILIMKKNLRYAYFNFLERTIDKMYVMFFLLVKKRF